MAGSLKKHIQIAKRNTRITPRLHGWLVNHPDGIKIESQEIATRVLEILTPSVGDRSGAFHPSQLYQCKRAQIFDYYGVDHSKSYNPTLQNLFNDGHFRHLRWQIMLLSAGILTDVEVGISIPEKRLVGSMDGMNRDEGWMFELKGTSQYAEVVRRGAMPEHIKQVNAYLLASGLESALIVYECKSSQNWVEIEVTRDEKIGDEINLILEELNNAIDSGTMPEVYRDCADQTGPRFSRCKYNSVCLGVSTTDDITPLLPPKRRASDAGRNAKGTKRVHRRAPRASRATD